MNPGRCTRAAAALLLPWFLAACVLGPEGPSAPEPCALKASEPRATPVQLCPPRAGETLGLLMEEVAALGAGGEAALRGALAEAHNGEAPLLREALLRLALADPAEEGRALELLERHQARSDTPPGEALLAGLLRDQLRARQGLRTSLAGARGERDALQRQLDELRAIEQQIRDRTRTPEMELRQ
ncbi:hypothetical protein Tgr7_2495 [Thioalkalivibrio sulfidiphilus HL-EbGr7]|uniref:Lipoprotein n=1 Tax=Thioalkalivibrio sulfidiphilus (strain HL-EbGR7) TaxID=396588 RepID=B8GLL7_THISH|nr:hypothetical protein [Thioalkalivibrio sulfidiphilus]ACL73572.1 hypothetical protein Tgr7_2495 [Thioalkalivibrio sulfidiphilus HL-EbGr7]